MGAETLMIFRGFERLAVVASGVLLIYFGCRLFLTLPAVHGSDGELKMPTASFTVSKVGPGVFFAVFGTFLLWQMAERVIRVDLAPMQTAEAGAQPRPQAVFGARAALPEPVWQPAWGGAEVAEAARLGVIPPWPLAEFALQRHRDCRCTDAPTSAAPAAPPPPPRRSSG
jgi:hypothetical protein